MALCVVPQGMEERPVELSSVGSRGTLRAPPTMSCPSENSWRLARFFLRKVSCWLFGAYRFAMVTSTPPIRALTNKNLPIGSVETIGDHSTYVEIIMDTPLDFASE